MKLRPTSFKPQVSCLLWAAALLLSSAGCTNEWQKPRTARIIPIEPGYAATKINAMVSRDHGILSFGGRQFVSFYDPEDRVTIAYRDLPAETWTVHHTDWKGNVRDAHNFIVMGISADGCLHISYDHHVHPLHYRRSAKPLDPTTFGPMIPMTGQRETKVTYPMFANFSDGTLLFFYRDGWSGRGDLCINRYDVATKEWQVLQHPLVSGAERCNSYWFRPAMGSDGSMQLAWVWRRSGDAETTYHVCYARSPDGGRTWQDSHGKPYQLPITPDTAEVLDPVPEGSNLNRGSAEVDSHNRFHLVYRKNDATCVPQYYHRWWDGNEWRCTQISQFTDAFTIKGPGTLLVPLSRPNLFFDKQDRCCVIYRDTRQGSRPMMTTAAAPNYTKWSNVALADVDLLQWEPSYDLARWRQEHVLNLFMQRTDQGDHETVTDTGPQMVNVLEWRP